MNALLQQAQAMHKKIEALKEELKTATVESSSGGGLVTVTVNGENAITNIHIDPTVLEDKEMLEALIISAVNDAQKKIKVHVENSMASITGGLSFPGLS